MSAAWGSHRTRSLWPAYKRSWLRYAITSGAAAARSINKLGANANPIENFIAPSNLLGLVRNTAPYLFPQMDELPLAARTRLITLGDHPRAFLQILQGCSLLEDGGRPDVAPIEDYFAYCYACHHAT